MQLWRKVPDVQFAHGPSVVPRWDYCQKGSSCRTRWQAAGGTAVGSGRRRPGAGSRRLPGNVHRCAHDYRTVDVAELTAQPAIMSMPAVQSASEHDIRLRDHESGHVQHPPGARGRRSPANRRQPRLLASIWMIGRSAASTARQTRTCILYRPMTMWPFLQAVRPDAATSMRRTGLPPRASGDRPVAGRYVR